MSEDEIIEIIRTRLSIDTKWTMEYMGDINGSGELYRDCKTVRLLLDGEVISEARI